MHGKGRVFYTSMGHREDVWDNPLFQNLLLGAPVLGDRPGRGRRDAEHADRRPRRRSSCPKQPPPAAAKARRKASDRADRPTTHEEPPMTPTTADARPLAAGLLAAAAGLRPTTPTTTDGFVQLFNGKDLTGWKTHPGRHRRKWEVEDGGHRRQRPGRPPVQRARRLRELPLPHRGQDQRQGQQRPVLPHASSARASRRATRPRSTPPTATRSRPAACTRLQPRQPQGREKCSS